MGPLAPLLRLLGNDRAVANAAAALAVRREEAALVDQLVAALGGAAGDGGRARPAA